MSEDRKEDLLGILKMRQFEKHSKYLGIPTIIGRSKKVIFGALLDRIWKKLRGWKEKILSRAEKEILLKSVIQAIPTYLMGVYKLSAAMINDIQSAMSRFFWGSDEGKRRLHWRNWKSMCEPKCAGGMGFEDLSVFNDAFLGKQAWRLVKGEESLLGRVMKAKYYPNCTFLDSSLGYCCSYPWKSVWCSKALILEVMIWRVGNGAHIRIREDPCG
ncbi:uncharacterized mitochondrial protein AtMg00310-like [Spinacia oleracea]|uniref:Uncharacterized mitochondrial protein AtMg00310-like n=1 Tax=Spinacia oleracea TaxID=3562 RepID=A0ABM3QWI4_SPIOL|nr:uncharacterized mitochondrial protein AtMg00310-like [Spinacia oleracea]